MKRIVINGSQSVKRTFLAKAFAAMTGMDYIGCSPYSVIAYQYKLPFDLPNCQWPDSFVYCLGAFTQKIMLEQKFEEKFISDGGVFNELSWIKCRFPHIELIYERAIIESFEKVAMHYASNEYDYILHIDSKDPSDTINLFLKRLYDCYSIKHILIDKVSDEETLIRMLEHLQVKQVQSAKYALLKFADEFEINDDTHKGPNDSNAY